MADYIKRENLIESIKNDCCELVYYSKKDAIDCINAEPAADVAPVVHGKWIFNDDWWEFRCTNCHRPIGNIKNTITALTAAQRWTEERKRMNKQEALTIARREVSSTELNLCRAQKRNAAQSELDGLKRKLEYKKYIMEAVEKYDGNKSDSVS